MRLRRSALGLLLGLTITACSATPRAALPHAHATHPVATAVGVHKTAPQREGACRTLTRHQLRGRPRLVREAGGLVLLPGLSLRTPRVFPRGHRRYLWKPPAGLPPVSAGRHVEVFYSPHPDDETLSMGVLIADAVRAGDRVIVVALTDGLESNALAQVNAKLQQAHHMTLSRQQLGAVRIAEMRQALVALGVAPGDLYLAHLDDPTSDCGVQVTLAEALQVERAFALRFPGATHVTMSYVAERQPDHLAAAEALLTLARQGVVRDPVFTVSRLWWQLPLPACHWIGGENVRSELVAAEHAYADWDPADGRYGIGYLSVPEQFDALLLDPRVLTHGHGSTFGACPRLTGGMPA